MHQSNFTETQNLRAKVYCCLVCNK